ncbi:MAG: DUF3021 domain-containing protein [Ruminococcaceae bacterium]|nr:DUF3021 domain-containing protein [Oscillospiraceae bacterium]
MKQFWKEFLLRGLLAASGGPVVLAIVYGILGVTGEVSAFTPKEVCLGILTVTLLAFIVAGMTAIYQIEQLPLPTMILLHGAALYIAYILIYLLNGWLKQQLLPMVIFTAAFVIGYAVIWLIIYCVERNKAEKLNKLLKK